MFVLVVEDRYSNERRTFDKDTVTVGRSRTNDITLPDANVSRRHARITRQAGAFYVEDLGSGNGTRVNDGPPISTMTPFEKGDRIHIGEFKLRLEPVRLGDEVTIQKQVPALEPTEAELVDAVLVEHDDDARLVYADWLEGHGMLPQAEYLRLEEQLLGARPDDPRRAQWSARLREVAPTTPLAWRRKLAHRIVEPCSSAHHPDCPREWTKLRPTGADDVRFCGSCDRDVFYCVTIDEARRHTSAGERVVVDASVPRSQYDLYPGPPGTPAPRR